MKRKLFNLLLLILISGSLRAQTAAEIYIEKYKDIAIRQMNQFGIPASVILAIAMHESGSGTSKIARNINNHFGIKGKNKVKTIRTAYKSYDNSDASYADFVRIIKEKPSFNKLFTLYSPYDYKNWVKGIQNGGYAQSNTWGSQVMAFIRKYKLDQYDKQTESFISAADTMNYVLLPANPAPQSKPLSNYYKVKKGDTLSGIAKKLGLSVKMLMKKNNLKSTLLKPGQNLKY